MGLVLLHGVVFAAVGSGNPLLDWLAKNITAAGLSAFIIVALLRGWLVPGKTLDRVLAERDRALTMIYELAETARRAVEAAERKKGA